MSTWDEEKAAQNAAHVSWWTSVVEALAAKSPGWTVAIEQSETLWCGLTAVHETGAKILCNLDSAPVPAANVFGTFERFRGYEFRPNNAQNLASKHKLSSKASVSAGVIAKWLPAYLEAWNVSQAGMARARARNAQLVQVAETLSSMPGMVPYTDRPDDRRLGDPVSIRSVYRCAVFARVIVQLVSEVEVRMDLSRLKAGQAEQVLALLATFT